MYQVNIHEAKTQLSKLIDQATSGQPVVIARHGKPVALLSAYAPDQEMPKRVGGQWKGQVWVAEDFDTPDPELEDLFYNGPVFPRDDLA
jgi:prevent-host-death family protein